MGGLVRASSSMRLSAMRQYHSGTKGTWKAKMYLRQGQERVQGRRSGRAARAGMSGRVAGAGRGRLLVRG